MKSTKHFLNDLRFRCPSGTIDKKYQLSTDAIFYEKEMAKSLEVVRNIGNFFGITGSQSEDWRSKAERQIKEGEFGLSLKGSVSKHNKSQEKFVCSAEKMLSRISAFQTFEESQDQAIQNKQVSTIEEQIAGCSQDPHDQALTLTTPKSTRSLGKQWTYNKTYTDSDSDDDTDVDSRHNKRRKSKTKVRFEIERRQGSERYAKSVGHLFQSELSDTEKQDNKMISSDAYVSYNTVSGKNPEEVNDIGKKTDKPKIIFFDELIQKCPRKTGFSDSEVISMKKAKLTLERANTATETETVDTEKKDEYTTLKEKPEKSRSSPEMFINEMKECAMEQGYATAISDASKTEQTRREIPKEFSVDNNDIITFEEKLRPEDVVYGKDALKHYKFYLKMEKNVEKKKLETELEERLQEYDWKIAAIDEMILLAKDYYVNPKSKNASKWKELKRQVKKSSSHKIGHTEVRRKLGALMEYRPYFTYLIIIAQIISFIVICGQRGFTDIGVEPRMTLGSDIQTFMGIETVHKWTAPNIWIGPSDSDLIGVGAVFAPCMREDIQLQLGQSRQNYSTDTPLGCCEVASRNVAGTATKSECEQFTEGVGNWRGDVTCNQRAAKESGVRHTMKPCCLGVKGQCRLLSHRHCVFLGGTFYQFGPEHCTQVMCLENVCRPGKLAASEVLPWQPESPSQWWRIPLSLLYHHGIIELVFVVAAQWILLSQIEFVAGWLRMLLIYLLSGTASLLTSAVFLPYQSHVGAVGAICGMTGVVLVELIHFWRLVHRPLIEVAKFLCAIVLMLFLGTLPYLDTFGMLTGFIVGILSGIILLPYITFGKWHTQVRVALIMVSLIVLFVLCYFLLQMFFTVQSVEGCEACRVLNCVPYTEKMCDSDLWQQF